MVFGKVPHLNNSAAIDVIRAPGGDVTALAFVCAARLPLLTAVLPLHPVS
jgi:hypothetical protein